MASHDRVDVKRSHLQRRHVNFITVLLVFSLSPITCNGITNWHFNYREYQMEALRGILDAWRGTPNLDVNLAGWGSAQLSTPCSVGTLGKIAGDGEAMRNWRGVQCLTNFDCSEDLNGEKNCSALITSLTLDRASIVGNLPPDVGKIDTLITLELTGNPNLTGTLPPALANNTNLNILKLSGNNFTGLISESQIDQMWSLQMLDLSRNHFEGEIFSNFLQHKPLLIHLDLSQNRFSGPLPNFLPSDNLQYLDMSSNKFTGKLPNLGRISSLLSVNLSRNALEGSISDLSNLILSSNSLSVLDLSHNHLGGALDSWNPSDVGLLQELYLDNAGLSGTLNITKLIPQTHSANSANLTWNLRVLSLLNNNISNVHYSPWHIENAMTVFRLEGNPYCKYMDSDDGTRCYCKQACFNSVHLRSNKRKVVIIAVVSSGVSVLLLIGLSAVLIKNNKYKQHLRAQEKEIQQKFEEFEVKPTIFPYIQLRDATREFHPDMKLGEGAFGVVYKGVLPNGHVVAVKQLLPKTDQGIDEFLNEVVLLTGIRHRNLVNLKGCCVREQQRLLVYEYVDNYDIEKILLGPNKVLVSWPVRFKMCLGVARGLHYLHEHAHPKIIHRDIKASNVLLTQNFEIKIADFGLAFLFPNEKSYIMTKHVAGTKGYMAPEYAAYGQLSDKVDVFSFGVLCLEIISGRRNIDEKRPLNEMYLPKWARKLLRQGKLEELIDPTMSIQDDEIYDVCRLINVALLCIQIEGEQRPTMERVVAMMQGESESEVVAPIPEDDESDDLGLLGDSRLTTLRQGHGISFTNSSSIGASCSNKYLPTSVATVELSEIEVR